MCQFISFFHKADADGKPEVAVWNLSGHSETSEHLKLNLNLWQEGHYTKDEKLELRYNNSFRADKTEYETSFKNRFPTFKSFMVWCFTQEIGGWLDVSGCDLKGVKLPEEIGGSLYVRGCDLKGVKLPEEIGGWLDVSGCDLKGVKLPENVICR